MTSGAQKCHVVQLHQTPSCPTCRLIRLRDPSRAKIYDHDLPIKRIENQGQSDVAHNTDLTTKSEDDPNLDSDPEPFVGEDYIWATLSWEATMDIFHGMRRTVANGPETLCETCNHWVNGLLGREECPDESEMEKLEPLARISIGNSMQLELRSNCPACRGIRQSLSRSAFDPDKNEDLAIELYKSQSQYKFRKYHGYIVYEDASKTERRCVFPISHRDTESAYFEVLTKADVLPKLASTLVNWELLLHWHKNSSNIIGDNTLDGQHGYNYDDQRLPPGFRLINVAEACLVEVDVLHPPCYAALSYVWGKSDDELTTLIENVQQFKQPGYFREVDMPLLFQDSFQVCSQLGVNYFWIDRICIVQDDLLDKSAQLEAMGKIYSMATFTIVSSEPRFVQQGLYGISLPRNPQVGFPIGDLLLLPPSSTDSNSTWLTRGWTYQEGFLSQRLLIFGESMVHMSCRGSKNDVFEGFHSLELDKSEQLCGSFDTRATGFAEQLRSYSTRCLTYDTDRLNAFLGVLSGFGRHLYGVPLKVFDEAMLWFPGVTDRSQHSTFKAESLDQHFPSWSWASSTMGAECRHNPRDWNPLYSIATWVTVTPHVSTGYTIELLDVVQASRNPEASKWIEIFRSCTSGLETVPGYTPVILAVMTHVCERYRLLKEQSTKQRTNDIVGSDADSIQSPSGATSESTQALTYMSKRKDQWNKHLWFEDFDKYIHQMPEAVRWEVLLRVAKPTFPDFEDASGPRLSFLETAAKSGRILVHAPKTSIMLKYQKKFTEGVHLWKMGHGGHLIGWTEIDDYRHQELLTMKLQDMNPAVVEVDCLATSVMGVRVEYTGTGRTSRSSSSDPASTVLVMVVSKASDDGCSHRLGVGYADLQAWGSLKAMVQTTILE
ncbi:hypothetical protein G7054_g6926 [Neopestalotiopsis clavispora]|nr:hypothetical protein G7054_g6926 [Neopestalotiopsis clavispora]